MDMDNALEAVYGFRLWRDSAACFFFSWLTWEYWYVFGWLFLAYGIILGVLAAVCTCFRFTLWKN